MEELVYVRDYSRYTKRTKKACVIDEKFENYF